MTGTLKENHIYPINHLQNKGSKFPGDCTYKKSNKSSHVDFALINCNGRKKIESFEIINSHCHIFDHKAIMLNINIDTCTSNHVILARAEDLNFEYDAAQVIIRRHNKQYNF